MKPKLNIKERAIIRVLLNTCPRPTHKTPTSDQISRYKGHSLSNDTKVAGKGWLPTSVIIFRAEGLERSETNFGKLRDSLVNKGMLEKKSFEYPEEKKNRKHSIYCYRLRRDKEGFTALYDSTFEDAELFKDFNSSEYIRVMEKRPDFAELFLNLQKKQLVFIEEQIEDDERSIIKLMNNKDGFLSLRDSLKAMMERTKAKQRK